MAKADALALLDKLLAKNHAELNADPGVKIVERLQEIRDEVDNITEA